MNTLAKRIATVAATLVLAGSLAAPASAAAGHYTCTSGTRFLVSDLLGYYIVASGCSGSGSGPGLVTIPSGTYYCQNTSFNTMINLLSGQDC